ncbi:MAG: hypothetical protein AB7T49_08435 [Oligoflexales bacterium]
MNKKILQLAFCLATGFATTSASADELSLVSGLFQSHKEKNEVTEEHVGTSNKVSLGGRYGIPRDDLIHFVGVNISVTTFDSSDEKLDPANATSFEASYGLRRMFASSSESLWPFLGVSLSAKSGTEGDFMSGGFRKTQVAGLFYGLEAGLRTVFGKTYFLDITSHIFQSSLFSTSKETLYSKDGETIANTETTEVQLFADTTGSINDIALGLGMIF